MAYNDDFLVEKLREILHRLYPTPQTSPILLANPSKTKFPTLFVTLSEIGNGVTNQSNFESNDDKSVGDGSEFGNVTSFGEIEIQYKDVNGDNVTLFPNLKLQEEGQLVGVMHNVSNFDHGENSTSFIVGKVNSNSNRDVYETALTRNLHEFIQVLKMSLNPSGQEGGVSIGGGGTGDLNGHRSIGMTGSGTTGVLSPNDLELNLTLDDIMDLNMLLDGSENVLQFKHLLIIFLYFLIAVISIVGNLLVVQLVIRSRRLHTLTHALLANLAVADLFMATLNIPFSAARVILAEWPFGSVLCHLVPFVQVTSVYVTSITMAVIAIDRYSVIMNPLGTRMKSSHGVLLVFTIWVFSGLLSLPYAIHQKVVRVLTVGVVSRCQADFVSVESRRWLTVGTFLTQYLIPLLFTTISYLSIMQRLSQRSDALGSTTPRQIAAQSRAKKKTIKMLALTVLFFAVSWAPINIYHLLTHFSIVRHNSTAILICHLVAMSSCTVNPFIYCWFNDHFRREALKWMRCFRTRRCPIVHPGVEINGMLTRADRACVRTQSTTFASTSLRSPRIPHSLSHQGPLRSNLQTPLFQTSHSPTSPPYHSGGYLSPSISPPYPKKKLLDHPLSEYYSTCKQNVDAVEIEVEVTYSERPESLFLVRSESYQDIFAAATSSKSLQDVEVVVGEVLGASDDDDEDEMQDYFETMLNFQQESKMENNCDCNAQCLLKEERNESENGDVPEGDTCFNSENDLKTLK